MGRVKSMPLFSCSIGTAHCLAGYSQEARKIVYSLALRDRTSEVTDGSKPPSTVRQSSIGVLLPPSKPICDSSQVGFFRLGSAKGLSGRVFGRPSNSDRASLGLGSLDKSALSGPALGRERRTEKREFKNELMGPRLWQFFASPNSR